MTNGKLKGCEMTAKQAKILALMELAHSAWATADDNEDRGEHKIAKQLVILGDQFQTRAQKLDDSLPENKRIW